MLFEIRDTVPVVSAAWTGARDRFLAGEVRAARDLTKAMRGEARCEQANDYVLLIEIARACGTVKRYLALVRAAMRRFPDDPIVRLYHARALLTRGRHLQAIRDLESLESTLGAEAPGLWASQLGNLWADCGFDRTSRLWMDRAAAHREDFESPLGLYTRTCAAEGLRHWSESAELGLRLVAAAPGWTRARSLVIHCLLAIGRIEEARTLVADGQRLGHEEAYFEFEAAMLAFSLGRFDEAHAAFDALRARWPDADFAPFVRRTLCILLTEAGRMAEAREVAAGEEEKLGLPAMVDEMAGAARTFLPMPLIAQAKNQCVPCVAAMALWPQGGRVDPEQAFREMKGREGTSLWRLRAWAREHGFECVPIKLEVDATRALLDLGIPLIGTLEGLFNSHVDVICGYHAGLDAFYVRDPMHWAPLSYPSALALERYRLHGATLALIDRTNAAAIAVAKSHRSDEGEALIDLHQAGAEGDREAADAAYARIPDGSDCDYLREVVGLYVAISPKQFEASVDRWAKPEEKRGLVRFRALLSRSGDDLDAFLRELNDEERERLGEGGRRYLRLTTQIRLGEWHDAMRRIDALLETGCGSPELWEQRSDVLAELGDEAGSRESLERALELEPLRMRLREKSLNRTADRLTFSEYLQEFDRLLADDPDDKRLLAGRAAALYDGPDGKAFEAAAIEVLRWFPRDPGGYWRLSGWYQTQWRMDLAGKVISQAKALMPQEFPDVADSTPAPPPSVVPPEIPSAAAPIAKGSVAGTAVLGDVVAEDVAPSVDRPKVDEGAEAFGDRVLAQVVEVAPYAVEARPAVPAVVPGEVVPAPPSVDETALPTDKETLLLLAGAQGEQRDAALEALAAMERQGVLLWHERARLLVALAFRRQEDASFSEADFAALFPLPTPGAPNWFVGYVYSQLTDGVPTPRLATAAIRWGEKAIADYRSHVAIWFDRVMLFEKAGDLEGARRELEDLLKRYPAHSSSLYRMGVIEHAQGDLVTALDFFERSLTVNPGLYGSLRLRKTVLDQLGRSRQAFNAARAIFHKFPYSTAGLKDTAFAALESAGPSTAFEVLDEAESDFDPTEVGLFRARLHLSAGDRAAAELALAKFPDPDVLADEAFEDYLKTRLELADLNDDRATAIATIRAGLARWSDSTTLQEMLGERLTAEDPDAARRTLEQLLLEGEPRFSSAYRYLALLPSPRAKAAAALIDRAKEDRRESLADLFSQAFEAPQFIDGSTAFHDWALNRFPKADTIKERFILHLDLARQFDRAIALAEELHESRPGDLAARRLLGRVLIGKLPTRAVLLLEGACEKNRDVDTLFDLARCYSVLGKEDASRAAHREILQQNPYQAASWTNLFLTNEPDKTLWPLVEPMLARGIGVDDEYFLVAAVQLAIRMKKTIPESWYAVARRRWDVLQVMPGFRDERDQLRKRLLAWEAERPADLGKLPPTRGGFFERLVARWNWFGARWIPKSSP